MIELGAASEDAVMLAFLRAEVDSPKWGPRYSDVMRQLRLDRASLIDAADLEETGACDARKALLGSLRGYGRNALLFTGFPLDATWRRVRAKPTDFHRLKCIGNDERWSKLTRGTRLIRDAALNLDDHPELKDDVNAAIDRIKRGLPVAELIMVENDSGDLILVEGHTRATAYAVLSDRPFDSFVGTSSLMNRWVFI
jgi:hypothetical protein